jgi:penicillin-binding protein 1A
LAKPSRGASKCREPSFKGGALSPVAPCLRTPHAKAARGRSDKRHRFGLARLIYWGAVLAIWAVLTVAGLFTWVGLHLPPIQSLAIPKRPPSIQINSLNARLFATRGEMGGAALPLKDMPAHLPNAFIAFEDRRFRFHHGIDPVGLFRAVVTNLLHRGISQGGSTTLSSLPRTVPNPGPQPHAQAAGGGAGDVAGAQIL